MSDFQVTIIGDASSNDNASADEPYAVNQHSRTSDKVIDRIDDLAVVWDQVVNKLTELADKSQRVAESSNYELSSIEFNLGIEAGLSVGLVTKGDASVAITFTRKTDVASGPDKSAASS